MLVFLVIFPRLVQKYNGDAKVFRWAEVSAREQTRPISGLFWPIFGLMAKIGHNFLLPFKNSAIYFRTSFFRHSDVRATVILSDKLIHLQLKIKNRSWS